jgi:hypothetical protein
MEIFLKDVRLSFPQLWEAKSVVDPRTGQVSGKPAWSGAFLLAKNHPQLPEILEVIKTVAREKWPGTVVGPQGGRPEWEAMLESFYQTNKLCIHDGDGKRHDGYAGHWYLSARSYIQPKVVNSDPVMRDADGKPIWDERTNDYLPNLVTQASGIIYAGCYVNVRVDIWAMQNAYGRRICATLKGVQFRRAGDAFAGGAPALTSDFEQPDLSQGAQAGAEAAFQTAMAAREDVARAAAFASGRGEPFEAPRGIAPSAQSLAQREAAMDLASAFGRPAQNPFNQPQASVKPREEPAPTDLVAARRAALLKQLAELQGADIVQTPARGKSLEDLLG